MRVTTRQDFQLHGVLKGDLQRCHPGDQRGSAHHPRADAATWSATSCAARPRGAIASTLRSTRWLAALVAELTPTTAPTTRSGSTASWPCRPSQPEAEPLYGERYLPRKFKTAIALEGDNCVDPPPRGGGSTQLSPSIAMAVLNLRGRYCSP